jgi:riboflavin biosynthesis pyrimidine reductase
VSTGTPLTQLLPHHRPLPPAPGEPDLVALCSDRSAAPRVALDAADPSRPWVRVNMVTTVDGQVVGETGLSRAISSPADKRVFGVLRALADAVVVGAGTARAERYNRLRARPAHAEARRARGQGPVPLLVLVSRSGRVDLDRLDEEGTGPVVVHASAAQCPSERTRAIRDRLGADGLVLHDGAVEPAAVLTDLRARGCREILHEGGPHLLADWVAAGAVDELCLTVSPLLARSPPEGSPHGLLAGGGSLDPRSLTLLSLVTDGSTLLQRWGLPLPE